MRLSNLILFIGIIFFGCSPTPTSNKNPEIGFTIERGLRIPIKEDFNPDISRVQYFESDSGEFLVIQNKTNFELGFFSLDDEKLKKTIPLSKEGPNGIGITNGFQVINKDSILIASIPPRIHILNFLGEKINSIKITDPDNKANYLSSNNETPLIFSEKKIYGAQPFFQDIYTAKISELANSKPFFKTILNKDSTRTDWLNIHRPEDEWVFGKKSLDLSWAEFGDTILVSPQLDHQVWAISKSSEKILVTKKIKANNINGFRIIDSSPIGDSELIKDLENGRYEILLFDTYRNVFYRFFYPGINIDSFNLTPRQLLANHAKVGIIIFNKELDIIGEHIFENNFVQPWNYFVGKKGLYVSINNPNRDDFDENFLRYDIIRFEGLNYED